MTTPTLAQIFGANATQNATNLTISKTDLAVRGLTASSSNTAESLLVALLLQWADFLTEDAQTANPDIQITISESDYQSIVTRNSVNYRQVTFNINLQTVDTTYTVDPDNYL